MVARVGGRDPTHGSPSMLIQVVTGDVGDVLTTSAWLAVEWRESVLQWTKKAAPTVPVADSLTKMIVP